MAPLPVFTGREKNVLGFPPCRNAAEITCYKIESRWVPPGAFRLPSSRWPFSQRGGLSSGPGDRLPKSSCSRVTKPQSANTAGKKTRIKTIGFIPILPCLPFLQFRTGQRAAPQRSKQFPQRYRHPRSEPAYPLRFPRLLPG